MTRFSRAAAAVILVCASAWLASSDGALRAQGASAPQQPQLLMMNEVNLKPDTAPEWAELQKNEVIPAQKKGGATRREAWANGPGGDPYQRVIITPIASLAVFDNPNPMVKALGQEGAAALGGKTRRLVASSRSRILVTRPDLGFGTHTGTPKIGVLSIVNVTNGHLAEFESFIKSDIIPALKKGGVTSYHVFQVVFGDDANQFFTFVPAADYAELAKGSPLERALGRDGMAKLAQKSGAFVTRLERRIVRYLPDLSFGPAAPTSH